VGVTEEQRVQKSVSLPKNLATLDPTFGISCKLSHNGVITPAGNIALHLIPGNLPIDLDR
jgi:hypothetical protein